MAFPAYRVDGRCTRAIIVCDAYHGGKLRKVGTVLQIRIQVPFGRERRDRVPDNDVAMVRSFVKQLFKALLVRVLTQPIVTKTRHRLPAILLNDHNHPRAAALLFKPELQRQRFAVDALTE